MRDDSQVKHNNNFDSRLKMVLSDVMTSTTHTIPPELSVVEAAKMMLENNVGSIVVKGQEGKKNSLGIITERDIVTRVVALGKNPIKIKVDQIATKPVITAPPTMDISKAMEIMAKMEIRRLIIVEENVCVGIVTYRDLLRVAPSLLEIAIEYEKIGFGNEKSLYDNLDFAIEDYDEESEHERHDPSTGFYCEQCGDWCEGSPLYNDDSKQVCNNCYNYLDEE